MAAYVLKPPPKYHAQDQERKQKSCCEKIKSSEGLKTRFAEDICARALDFGIVSRRDGAFESTVVKKDSLVAMLPPNHPLAQAKSVPAYAMGFISEL